MSYMHMSTAGKVETSCMCNLINLFSSSLSKSSMAGKVVTTYVGVLCSASHVPSYHRITRMRIEELHWFAKELAKKNVKPPTYGTPKHAPIQDTTCSCKHVWCSLYTSHFSCTLIQLEIVERFSSKWMVLRVVTFVCFLLFLSTYVAWRDSQNHSRTVCYSIP
jgi:hypothetical protein